MLPRSLALLSVCTLFTSGCTFSTQHPEPYTPAALPSDYAWPPKILTEAQAQAQAQAPSLQAKTVWRPTTREQPLPTVRAGTTPTPMPIAPPPAAGGCLDLLNDSGAEYQILDSKRGVMTPVQVKGDLGGIRYVPTGGLPLIVDCRFAITLLRVAPVLRELGVNALHYSGAYVYRMSSKGRLSLHANGLAIDIHEVTIGGEQLSVKRHFAKGLGESCASNLPPLNRVACHLKRTRVFRELLTPDYDANHHDHFHLAISQSAVDR
jgi:hypothetical protein